MRAVPALLLLSACAAANVRTPVSELAPGEIDQVVVEVVNATGRELPAPRPGIVSVATRMARGGGADEPTTVDVLAGAVAEALHERGVETVSAAGPETARLRVVILDLDVRNHDSAGAVAFVSAQYVLVDAGSPRWEIVQTRLPVRMGGPDLTRPALERIAAEAARRALSSFPPGP